MQHCKQLSGFLSSCLHHGRKNESHQIFFLNIVIQMRGKAEVAPELGKILNMYGGMGYGLFAYCLFDDVVDNLDYGVSTLSPD
jgi:hypothetical protein